MEALTFLLVLIPRGQTLRLPPAAWPLGWAIKENHKTQNHGITEPGDRAGRWPLTLASPKWASSLSTLTSHTAPSPCQILAQLADPWKHRAPRVPALSLASSGHCGRGHVNHSSLVSCPQGYISYLWPGPQQRPGHAGGRPLVCVEG